MKLSYITKLVCSSETRRKLLQVLELERNLFNLCSSLFFGQKIYSLKNLHNLCYYTCKSTFPDAKSQFIIKAEQDCLAAYKSIRSNKQKLVKSPVKKRLSIQLDKRICTLKNDELILTTCNERVKTKFVIYPKLANLISKHTPLDPKLFEKDGDLYVIFVFDVPTAVKTSGMCLGVDLGYRRYAATSEGKLFIDKIYNKHKRKVRYLKRCLQRKNTQSSKKHLQKVRHKEHNQSKNFNHHLANAILNTKANTIVLEELNVRGLKKRKHKYKSRSRKTQVSLFEIRRMLTYKAELVGKQVVCVNPAFTSQLNCFNKKKGERRGCRFYSGGLVFDADINAAINIAKRAKLPISQGNPLDGQAVVNQPIVGKLSDQQIICF